ncbi:MAG: ABC transporter substrate-binding protein [Peptococcaceae bacterium]|jgi:hypothetical protein|nr:ABC transporter substrate-binding protein [Peptococcaceae bacterium]
MLNIKLLWSNVCVLSVQEQKIIAAAVERLRELDIDLTVEYYGLAKEETLAERIARAGFDADIMVSTDVEVFQKQELFGKFRNDLLPALGLLPIKEQFRQTILCSQPLLLPIHFVPLIMVANRSFWSDPASLPASFADIADTRKAFGGRDNAAGQGLKKQLRSYYGDEFETRFCSSARIFEMPVEAFNAVRRGEFPVAIAPTIFAMRADGEDLIPIYPKEGAASVPCFAAVKNTTAEETAKAVLGSIFTSEVNSFYTSSGNIQICLENSPDFELAKENNYRFLYTP